ncbi:kelch repeat-containing protein [Conexibacter woesei]|uniref:Kelch repeat-containing protein n=1 Tax=Conexibacter woesei (strain DSM 14684 / CCUG 47730 / CIP 108061 / JCM 11494 / NBRC 100937 / ID131577) TaxID=469383 RepID=D3FF71_CONWI|nr:kelch repeat-containing protein [Conexibacter woesei]ADB51788.1 Kelch repeat-containing protein [Conexibacter woesei DSM 14684]
MLTRSPSRTGLVALLAALALAVSAASALAGSGWHPVASMSTVHRAHGAVLLRDGRVLIASGTSSGGAVATAELYDPVNGSWTPAAPPLVPRHYATATRLIDGRVLLVGGAAATGVTTHAELYDPTANTWTATGAMNEPRNGHAAVLLADGRVLVAGGADDTRNASATSEVYDPATGLWTPTAGTMSDSRENLHAALLDDGRVLVAGGYDVNPSTMFRSSADVYDPATNSWSPTGALATSRGQGGTAVLPDGRVLAVGGVNHTGFLASIELYDPVAASWSPGGAIPHAGNVVTATALDDGRVLIQSDGSTETVLFDPATNALSPVAHQSSAPRGLASLTVLEGGRVLMAGGNNLATAELFTPPAERSAALAGGFGDVPVGASAERDVTVENSGRSRLWIDATALAGAAAADYEIVADDCTGAQLLPARRCVVRVRFTPSASSARAAELTFDDNAEQSPAFALDGAGVVPPEGRPSPPEAPRPPAQPTPDLPRQSVPPVPRPAAPRRAAPRRAAPRRAAKPISIERFALVWRCVRPLPSGSARVGLALKLTRQARVRIEVSRAIGTRGRTLCPPRGSGSFDGDLANPLVRARGTTRTAVASSVMQRHVLRLRLRPALYRITVRPYTGPGRLGRPAHRWLRVLAP